MECPDCKVHSYQIDTTQSTTTTDRATIGQITGDVYICPACRELWLDNHLTGKVEPFTYD